MSGKEVIARAAREEANERLLKAMTGPFQPDYASPPGDTLRELLEMRGWTQALLSREMGSSLKHVNRVISGKESVSVAFALALEKLDFASAEFWMHREVDYRVHLARLTAA